MLMFKYFETVKITLFFNCCGYQLLEGLFMDLRLLASLRSLRSFAFSAFQKTLKVDGFETLTQSAPRIAVNAEKCQAAKLSYWAPVE